MMTKLIRIPWSVHDEVRVASAPVTTLSINVEKERGLCECNLKS
jgi:hypothetical protein